MFLVSSDDVVIEISDGAAVLSDLLKGMLEDLDGGVMERNHAIPIYGVDGRTLSSVVEYCETQTSAAMRDSEWDAEFIKGQDEEALLALTNAASYMVVEPLFELGCCRIADLMRDKDPEEVRTMMAR